MPTKKPGYSNIPVYMININILVSDCYILLVQSPWRPQKWYFVLCVQVFLHKIITFAHKKKEITFQDFRDSLYWHRHLLWCLFSGTEWNSSTHHKKNEFIVWAPSKRQDMFGPGCVTPLSDPAVCWRWPVAKNAPHLLPVAHTINQLLF